MLNQYEQRQLHDIESRLEIDDPELVRELRSGRPRPTPVDRMFTALGFLGLFLIVFGIVVGAPLPVFLGAGFATAGFLEYWRRRCLPPPEPQGTPPQ